MKYHVNWTTKAHGLKFKEFSEKEKEKAYKCYRSHSNQDATIWAGEEKNYEDYFRVSWLTSWGDMKTELDIKEEFEKFLKRIEEMLKV